MYPELFGQKPAPHPSLRRARTNGPTSPRHRALTGDKMPIITCTPQDLSKAADQIVARANGALTKPQVLNILAAQMAGPKTNWGGLLAKTDVVSSRAAKAQAKSPETITVRPDGEINLVLTKSPESTFPGTVAPYPLLINRTDALEIAWMLEREGKLPITAHPLRIKEVNGQVHLTLVHETSFTPLHCAILSRSEFDRAMREAQDRARQAILATPAGKVALSAFDAISQTQDEILEAAEEGLFTESEIEAAVERTALKWICDQTEGGAEHIMLVCGEKGIENRILDEDWTDLLDVLDIEGRREAQFASSMDD